ncbi:MAG: alpha-N-acetylglucosaminidase TIM-barrel domain-containing protein [Thermoguttaceae bacterium]
MTSAAALSGAASGPGGDLPEIALAPANRVITQSVRIKPGRYEFADPEGKGAVRVEADNVTVDFQGATLQSCDIAKAKRNTLKGLGINVQGRKNVTIKNAKVFGYKYNIRLLDAENVQVESCDVSYSLAERLMDKGRAVCGGLDLRGPDAWRNYGAGIWMEKVRHGSVRRCSGLYAQNGLLLFHSDHCLVTDNDFSCNSGWGIGLYMSSDNVVSWNLTDFVIRPGCGDSASIVATNGANRNYFVGNSMTHSGDGFFLSNLTDVGEDPVTKVFHPKGSADDNVIAYNDGSWSPCNAFEGTFAFRNVYYNNIANDSGYGFWLGYSCDTLIADNEINHNRADGVAIEQGHGNLIEHNTMEDTAGTAVHLWAAPPTDRPRKRWPSKNLDIRDNIIRRAGAAYNLANSTDYYVGNNTLEKAPVPKDLASSKQPNQTTGLARFLSSDQRKRLDEILATKPKGFKLYRETGGPVGQKAFEKGFWDEYSPHDVRGLKKEFVLVRQGAPQAVIVVGDKATRTERHAADELVAYVRQLSGATLPVTTEGSPAARGARRQILIGRPETSAGIMALRAKGQLDLSADHPGLDGFVIRTVGDQLVLGGSRDRGTLFAVYYLLEKYFKVGFFWDGEYVPASKDLALPAIRLAERPRFATRLCAMGGDYSFGGKWGFPQWKKELDWLPKNRFNTACLAVHAQAVEKAAMEKMGVGPQRLTDEDKAEVELAKRIYDYARTLDLEVPTPAPGLAVMPEFVKAHPEGKYFVSGWWADELAGRKSPQCLYPTDPLYAKRVKTYIETWIAIFGTWHLYMLDPPAEANVKTTDDERKRINASFSVGPLAGIKAADPQGVWCFSAWGWVFDQGFWPQPVLKEFLERIPPQGVMIWDIWADGAPQYCSERCKGFLGRNFTVGFLHQYGGDDYLHGNFPRAIEIVRDAAKFGNCTGMGLFPEVMHYSPHYYDLLTRVGWNPAAIELSAYLDDMVLRRYGAEGYKPMRAAFQGLVDTVYGGGGSSEAPYQHRLYPGTVEDCCHGNHPAGPVPVERINKLAGFLRAALALPPEVRGRRLVENDLVDVFRQYASEVFMQHLALLEKAAAAKDIAKFEAEAKILRTILDQLEVVLSSRPDYRLEDIIRSLAGAESGPRREAIKAWLRDTCLTFAISYPSLLDYQSKDIYELNRFYYRPRVERYLTLRLEALKSPTGWSKDRNNQLIADYHKIELAWCKSGCDPQKAPPYTGPMWQAVQEAFAKLASDARTN